MSVIQHQFLLGTTTEGKIVFIRGGSEPIGTVSFNHDAYESLYVLTIRYDGSWSFDAVEISHTLNKTRIEDSGDE